jgi:hypothetical protein
VVTSLEAVESREEVSVFSTRSAMKDDDGVWAHSYFKHVQATVGDDGEIPLGPVRVVAL